MGANWDLKWILVHKVRTKMGSLFKTVKEPDDRESPAWTNIKPKPRVECVGSKSISVSPSKVAISEPTPEHLHRLGRRWDYLCPSCYTTVRYRLGSWR